MKRIFALIPMLPLLLTGCTGIPATPGKTVNRMAGGFVSDVTVTTADSQTRAVLTRYGTDAWEVCFCEPAALDGVELRFLDGEVTASYKGLEFSVPQSAQALRTEFAELMHVVDSNAPLTELDTHTADELFVSEGELEVGSYTLSFAQDGTPVQFSLPAYGVLITFDTFTDADGCAVTETSTIPKTYPVTDVVTETST
ncbi:MAG: hypothetical protein K6F80_06230 [Oscillospiraceae bacterium]|nr:hypothetical protein [Oscillospiraceae bacterium]